MEARGKGGNAVVVTGGFRFGGDTDSGQGGGADGGVRGEVWEGDYNGRLVKWGGYCSNDNVMYRAHCPPCLYYGTGTPPPDYE